MKPRMIRTPLGVAMVAAGIGLGGCSNMGQMQKQNQDTKSAEVQEAQQVATQREQEIEELKITIRNAEGNLAQEREARARLEQLMAEQGQAPAPTQSAQLLPPNAKPGECYARVFLPPQYKTETMTVLKKDASERIEVIPAQYKWVEETVTVKEPSEKLEVIPAQYKWVEEQVLVRPASQRIEEIPPVYKTVQEKVLDKPEHTVWQKGTGPITKIDASTGEIMCLVTIPATYKTVTKRVLVTPASTRVVDIPAEYKTVKKRVMAVPPTTRKVEVPGEYKTIKRRQLVQDAQTRKIPVSAEYETVTKRIKTSDGSMEWRPVLCKTNMNERIGADLQRALQKAGYNPGPIDGIIGRQTMAALNQYQRDHNMASGGLTINTLNKLGVKLN